MNAKSGILMKTILRYFKKFYFEQMACANSYGPKNFHKIERYLILANENDSKIAMLCLADIYENGTFGYEKNLEKSILLFKRFHAQQD